jgi:glutamine synthetase type III
MAELRAIVDEMESITAKEHWPLPAYGDLLFSVK